MDDILDRPIWSALATRHAALAEGSAHARRYPASIVPFATARDDSPESLAALEALVRPDESVILLQGDAIALPPGLVATSTADGVQMVAETLPPEIADPRIVQLGEADAADMLALATLTKPGPFSMRALSLGAFWGVRIGGTLAAMAGERMKQVGATELSGVCAHPDFRGKGLGRLLSVFVARRILERGERPYLHAYAANNAAIALYEKIGFRLRRGMHVAVVQRRA